MKPLALTVALVAAATLGLMAGRPGSTARAAAQAGVQADPPQAPAVREEPLLNPAIDMAGHLRVARAAAEHRATRRVDEAAFLRLAAEPGTVILDARSPEKFALLHVKGAVNLTFADITADSLAAAIPTKATRVLIYCNNNFKNAERPFPSKLPAASLNLSTYAALFTYGYENVYELSSLLDPKHAKLPLVSGGPH